MGQPKKYFKELGDQFTSDYSEFLKLIPTCKQFDPNQVAMIYKALHKAILLHEGQKRKSGEPYVNHPISVASVVASYGLDFETVCAALLHDTIEDTSYTLNECEKEFGSNITSLVDGVTKVGKDINDLTHEKILQSTQNDARSIAIKSSDRLHNMYTLDALPLKKQIEISTETKEFYVPITKILGIYQLKDELQDLCLFYLDNDAFLKYYKKRKNLNKKYGSICEEIGDLTQDLLSKLGIAMRYNYRIKNVGGIYDEIISGTCVNDIEDLLAIKMVLNDRVMCYQALGAVHGFCKPIAGKMHDFIACPKTNGYKSLNTNVLYKDADIQVRIRTNKMQGVNNLGVFSDWNETTKKAVSYNMRCELNNLSKKIRGDK